MPYKFLNFLKHLPTSCILCDDDGLIAKDICEICFKRLLKNEPNCYQCGLLLNQSTTNNLCGGCQSAPPDFQLTHAAFLYQGAMRYLISQLKFNRQYKNARLLGQLLAESLPKTALPQCIIPVPLHKKRYRQRGFNQSLEIAKTVSKQLHIPVDNHICIRTKNTAHQVGLNSKQRGENIKNAFSIIKPREYTHIAILDDVLTTGSTVRELAAVFKKSGVTQIDIWVCARANIS